MWYNTAFGVAENDFFVERMGEIGRSSGIIRPSWSLEEAEVSFY